MQITTTFESIEEMKEFMGAMNAGFAQTKSDGQSSAPALKTSVQTAPIQTAPVQAVPVQQAPVQAVPVQQSAPIQRPMPAPVRQSIAGPVPTSTPSYTADDLAKAAMTLMDSGKQGDLINLLGQFGVNSLPDLPPEKYGAFATALRGMGAQI